MSDLNHGLNQTSQAVACLPNCYREFDKGVSNCTTQVPLGQMKEKMQFNIYRYSPVWQLFQCQLSLHPGRITCFLFTLLFYLAISVGLAASSNNLSLDYLHATCFYTSIQKTHNNSSVKYISHKVDVPLCTLFLHNSFTYNNHSTKTNAFESTLHFIFSLKKITTEIKTTRLLTISVIYKKKNPQLYLTLYLSSQLLLNYS